MDAEAGDASWEDITNIGGEKAGTEPTSDAEKSKPSHKKVLLLLYSYTEMRIPNVTPNSVIECHQEAFMALHYSTLDLFW